MLHGVPTEQMLSKGLLEKFSEILYGCSETLWMETIFMIFPQYIIYCIIIITVDICEAFCIVWYVNHKIWSCWLKCRRMAGVKCGKGHWVLLCYVTLYREYSKKQRVDQNLWRHEWQFSQFCIIRLFTGNYCPLWKNDELPWTVNCIE